MDNPETEYSLSQRKKSGPYHHNIQVIITFRLMFNLPGRYLTTSTHESWALAIQNRSRFPEGTVFFLVPRPPPSASSMPIFSLEGPAPPHPFSLCKTLSFFNTQLKHHLLSEAFLNSILLSCTVVCSLWYAYTKAFVLSGVYILQCFSDSFTSLSLLTQTGSSSG